MLAMVQKWVVMQCSGVGRKVKMDAEEKRNNKKLKDRK